MAMKRTPWKGKADWQEKLRAVPPEQAAEEFKRLMERLRRLPPGNVVWHINADAGPEADDSEGGYVLPWEIWIKGRLA